MVSFNLMDFGSNLWSPGQELKTGLPGSKSEGRSAVGFALMEEQCVCGRVYKTMGVRRKWLGQGNENTVQQGSKVSVEMVWGRRKR